MQKLHSALLGLIQAVAVVIYTAIISGVFKLLERVETQPPEFWGFVLMLTLLVFSAAICGTLIFGYPIYFAINKKTKKGLATLGYTLLFLVVIIIIAVIIFSLT